MTIRDILRTIDSDDDAALSASLALDLEDAFFPPISALHRMHSSVTVIDMMVAGGGVLSPDQLRIIRKHSEIAKANADILLRHGFREHGSLVS